MLKLILVGDGLPMSLGGERMDVDELGSVWKVVLTVDMLICRNFAIYMDIHACMLVIRVREGSLGAGMSVRVKPGVPWNEKKNPQKIA